MQRNEKQFNRWVRWMEIGGRIGCHQMPERSFFVKGYQFPVCARCCGVFIGYVVGLVAYCKISFQTLKFPAVFGMFTMFIDWFIQAIHIKQSTNVRRLLTGIVGGFGCMVVFLRLMGLLFGKIRSLKNM